MAGSVIFEKNQAPMEMLETPISDYELERGKPRPSFNHSIVQSNLIAELRNRLRQTHTITSELNLALDGKKLVPDLAIFPKLAPDMQHDILWVKEAPLTTIEILSPKQDLDSRLEKARFFLAAGVRSCWLVLPAVGTIALFTSPSAYRSFTGDGAVLDEILGVEIPLVDIFG